MSNDLGRLGNTVAMSFPRPFYAVRKLKSMGRVCEEYACTIRWVWVEYAAVFFCNCPSKTMIVSICNPETNAAAVLRQPYNPNAGR